MIDEELLAQKALRLKLERQAHVRAMIEAMRTRTLAQAYMQFPAASERENPDKVKAFYRENPALFGCRSAAREGVEGEDAERCRRLAQVARNIAFTLGEEIPMELLAKVFDKSETDPRKESGWGLGLAIVKTFIEAHEGTVSVESREGLGSTFRFTLPPRQIAAGRR